MTSEQVAEAQHLAAELFTRIESESSEQPCLLSDYSILVSVRHAFVGRMMSI